MTLFEIVLILIGIAGFVASYFIPERESDISSESLSREEIRELVYEEFDNSKNRLIDITDETINYSVEKAERSLERISNEKMLALGEYSDTIMNQINTNHQETVFLSDMLNSNKNDLTVMLGQAIKDSKEASENADVAKGLSKKALEESREALENARKIVEESVVAEEKLILTRKAVKTPASEPEPIAVAETKTTRKSPSRKSTSKKKANKEVQIDDDTFIDNDGQISLKFDENEESDNKNDKVLKLHKNGKSNVAIARELGLGVGEVNLIINLFERNSR